MNRSFKGISLALLAFVLLASCATTSIRYSSNPIGKLAVLGIQISESVDAANRMLQDPFGKNFLKNIDWPLVIDPSYKQLKEAKAVTLSLNNEQAGGITYTSALLGDMAFAEDMPGFILVLDRAHRVRGYGRGFIMDGQRQDTVEREANRLVEDLLLNLDKSEKITYAEDKVQQQGIVSLGKKTVVGTDDPANFDFQTDLKKAMIEESRKKSGASVAESPFFKYLGKPVPNYSVKRPDGSAVKLHDLLGPRVTMLVVFISPENQGMRSQYNGVGMTLQTARSISDNFARGEAGPGKTNVPNAHPDAE
jgi:hypothetical protein